MRWFLDLNNLRSKRGRRRDRGQRRLAAARVPGLVVALFVLGLALGGIAALDLETDPGTGLAPSTAPVEAEANGGASGESARPVADLPEAARLSPAPGGSPPPDAEIEPPTTVRPAWRRQAVPLPQTPPELPRLAIVIDDLGLSATRAARAVALPPPLTLALLPYGEDLPALAQRARAAGHELLVHVPMAPRSAAADPGPQALYPEMPPAELRTRLAWALSRFEDYVGINNHMGSRLTESASALRPVLRELRARGLMFLDSRTTAASAAPALAAELGLPFAQRDVFLDNVRERAAIAANLDQAAARARKRGAAVAIGHPYPETLAVLADWLPKAAAKGVALVPVSAVARVPAPGGQMARR